ncbi:MAG: DUF4340 domain-containing protein [Bacteroidetes bacterium]|nr:DUF4340 domain-containing protein [Bacteroidota bacterium]
MKQKQLLWLLATLIVLLGLAYLTGVFERDASTVDVPDVDIPADALEQVRIEAPEHTWALQRQGTRWLLTEPVQEMTDSAAVARFVRDLGALELESVASNNPERYRRYGVDSTASVVSASWADGDRRLVVGNQGPDFQSIYVRLDDDPRVYLTRGRLTVPDDLDRWRDKTIVNLPRASVASVVIEGPEHTFEVQPGPGGWQLVEQGAEALADSAAVAQWLGRFVTMRADGFIDDLPAAVVRETAGYRLVFTTTAGATETIQLLERDDDLAVTTAARNITYRLRTSRLQTYVPDPASLISDGR